MQYLIIIYKNRENNPISSAEIIETKLVSEQALWEYLQNNRENSKFTVEKLETLLDYS